MRRDSLQQYIFETEYQEKTLTVSLDHRATLFDLWNTLGSRLKIPTDEIIVSIPERKSLDCKEFSWAPVVEVGESPISSIFDPRHKLRVDREKEAEELKQIIRQYRKQKAEYDAKQAYWAAGGDDEEVSKPAANGFVIATFEQWKLKVGEWGFHILDDYAPDFEEVKANVRSFRREQKKHKLRMRTKTVHLYEIEVFEEIQRGFNEATTVENIVTGYLQLSEAMDFKTSSAIGQIMSGFVGGPEYIATLTDDARFEAIFWNRVCFKPEIMEQTYNTMTAGTVLGHMKAFCKVKPDSRTKLNSFIYALRKAGFSDRAPDCTPLEDLTLTVTKAKHWDLYILRWFIDLGLLEEDSICTDKKWDPEKLKLSASVPLTLIRDEEEANNEEENEENEES